MSAAGPLLAPAGEGAALLVGRLRFRLHHAVRGLPPALPDRTSLGAAIQEALRDTLDPGDDAYWVVRSVSLPFRAEPALGVPSLAERFALALRGAVQRILRGEVVEGIYRYDSRAHWLAECLWAQARGAVGRQWQFGRYRHHDALPVAAAVRLTLAAEPGAALRALSLLAEDRRICEFASRIGEDGARGVLALLLPQSHVASASPTPRLRALLAQESAASPRRPFAAMLAVVARHHEAGPAPPLPAFRKLRQAMAEAQIAAPARARESGADDASPAEAVIPGTAAPLGPVQLTLRDRSDSGGRPRVTIAPDTLPAIETSFAGIFVLWRSVREMGLDALLPAGEAGGPARLALASAMAGRHHRAAWDDPALHWLCNYYPQGAPPAVPPPDLAGNFLDHYRAWCEPRLLTPTLVRAGRSWLVQDRHSEDWLAFGSRRECEAACARVQRQPVPPAADARDPAIDIARFDVSGRRTRRSFVLLARAAYGDFARRLHGLERSSAAWLWERLLAGWGTLEQGAPARILLPRVPLDLVLRMGGLDGTSIQTPGRLVRLVLPGAA